VIAVPVMVNNAVSLIIVIDEQVNSARVHSRKLDPRHIGQR